MAAQLTQAGTITREQTFLPIRRFPVSANTTVVKGDVLYVDNTSGRVSKGVAATANEYTVKVVALGSADNGSGDIGGEIDVPCAVRGHFVTVVAGGAIKSGQRVQMSTTTNKAGTVTATAITTNKDVVGIYWAKEGGTIAKGTGTPWLETFTDTENWKQVDAKDTEIVEIELF